MCPWAAETFAVQPFAAPSSRVQSPGRESGLNGPADFSGIMASPFRWQKVVRESEPDRESTALPTELSRGTRQ